MTPPSITLDDGFTITVGDCGGFDVYTPEGRCFGWSETIEEAQAKIDDEKVHPLFANRRAA